MIQQHLRMSLAAIAVSALVAVAAACGDDDDTQDGSGATVPEAVDVAFASPEQGLATEYAEPKSGDLTIGFLNPRRATEVLQTTFDAAKDRVEELGGKSIELDAQQNPDLQVSQFEQLLAQDVDAIGILPIAGPKLLGSLLTRAAEAGIPVIGIDVTPGKPGRIPGFASQVWQRRDRMVYLQVKAAAEELGSGARVGHIGFAVPVPVFEFAEVRTQYWAKQFGLEIVDAVDSQVDSVDGGQQAASGLLAKNPDIVGVLGYDDEAAIGATLAARSAGRDDVTTYGIIGGSLAVGALENDRLTATVFLDGAEMGRTLADGLYNAAQGTEIPPVVLAGDPFVITTANLDELPTE